MRINLRDKYYFKEVVMRKLAYFTVFILIFVFLLAETGFAGSKKEKPTGAIGGSVSVIAQWGGNELEIFNKMKAPFEKDTGIKVEYEGTRDINAILTTRVQAGNPPDIAVISSPAKMAEFAKAGKLVDLSNVLDISKLKKDYAQGWLDLATVDGKLVGVFVKTAVKGTIWYSPPNLKKEGIAIPKTWDKLMEESKKLASEGKTPWSVGLESGSASGWSGTDWIEDIVLRTAGPKKYVDWYKGKLAWTSPEIKKAWQMWGEIVANEKMIYGGKQYVLSTNFGQAAQPLFTEPPSAYFHHQATFMQGFIAKQFPNLEPGKDYNFFAFPTIDKKYAKAVEGAGDVCIMFNDTPQAEAFIKYFAGAKAQTFWVKSGSGLSANRSVALSDYPDDLSRNAAKILTSAEMVVFDASDMMPSAMNQAFWGAVLDYVQNPQKLDSILEKLDKIREDVY